MKRWRVSCTESQDIGFVTQHQPEVFGVSIHYVGDETATKMEYFYTEAAAVLEAKTLILAEMIAPPLTPDWTVTEID